ncbi:phosphoenolpyruvate--protein phosphotransferase [Miltoncostaea marina]|uniref:phosphoenolpyruvate--protein phosphotransferase n=1 Tax=Miltoncostaea marina TaxID=2843215 RepID=UPI001C3DEA7B|nr:phosphoenolpyruvate--protein phosphotransferase [Miltoncostaea marina]
MVGVVIVSHSAGLADGVAELAREMAGPEVPVEAAGGLDEPGRPTGTDAALVMAALERVLGGGGEALVLMDLGSAVMSAETAIDLLPDDARGRVRLCAAPLVEGAVAAAAAARGGAGLDEVEAEALRGLAGKRAHLGAPGDGGDGAPAGRPARDGGEGEGWEEATAVIRDPLGLHARPAASLVRAVAGLDADVRISNDSAGTGPASARSLTALSALGVLEGHRVRIAARGPDARAALGALLAAIAEGADAAPAPAAAPERPEAAPPAAGEQLRGVAAAPGAGIGPARVPREPEPPDPAPAGTPHEEEWALLEARAATAADLRAAGELAAERAGREAAEIIEAQLLVLDDEELVAVASRALAEGVSAAAAWDRAVRAAAAAFDALDDEYLRQRAADLREVGRRVLAHLAGAAHEEAAPGVVVVGELGAAEAAVLDPQRVAAVASAGGGPSSHAAIIARAIGVPYVAGLGPRVLAVADGAPLLVDGDAGTVTVDPPPDVVEAHRARHADDARRAETAREHAHEPAVTRDGVRVEVEANIGAPGDALQAVAAGADGVGLLRTELLFLGRAEAPDEEEQRLAYVASAAALAGRRVTLRTLDAGGDKPLPYLTRPPEDNPFLGVRGVRLSLERPELMVVQLRAALRAAAEHPLAIMFPMVSEVGELRAALGLLDQARDALAAEGIPAGDPEVGVMVEVPAAAVLAGAFAPHVAFLSIGTNDLVQYTMAAERGNGALARLADPLHPAVLRLIDGVVRAAGPHGCRVAVCGEAASDPVAVPVLVGLGVRELSVAPPLVPGTKAAVRATDAGGARELASRALELSDAAAVRALVTGAPA